MIYRTILFFSLFLTAFSVLGKERPFRSDTLRVSPGNGILGLNVICSNPIGDLSDRQGTAWIKLFVNSTDESYNQAYQAKVRVTVLSVDYTNKFKSATYNLDVSYTPLISEKGLHKGVAYVYMPNVKSLALQVDQIAFYEGLTGTSNLVYLPTYSPKNVYIAAGIDEEIFVKPPASVIAGSTISPVADELQFNLQQPTEDIDGYELEWTYIDGYTSQGLGLRAPSDVSYNFENNATRISITPPNYSIKNIFGVGYVAYRYRYFSYFSKDKKYRRYSAWSCDNNCSNTLDNLPSNYYHTIIYSEAHQTNLNWQYSATYSENGKRSEMVSYFDGLNKPHQQVSYFKSIGEAIVSETFYDAYNRPSIEVLPTPSYSAELHFYNGFNRPAASTSRAFNYTDFQGEGNGECAVGGPALDSTGQGGVKGAGYYYSSYASRVSQGIHDNLVPSAGGFPYVQTDYEYSPDNRVLAKSMPGKTHRLGLSGENDHATRMLYGNASQHTLDRLFGTDVGNSAYYRQVVSQDANQQVSVSYLNQQGQTIASALVGNAQQGIERIDGVDSTAIYHVSDDILVNNILDGSSKVNNYQLLVSNQGTYFFNYQIEKAQFIDAICDSVDALCYSCPYELLISIEDACGALADTIFPIVIPIGTLSDTICTTPDTLSHQFATFLSVGSYMVHKELRLVTGAVDSAMVRFLAHNEPCIDDLSTLVEEELARMDISNCFDEDCEVTCLNSLPADAGLWERYQCEVSCSNSDPCLNTRPLLAYDVNPSAQYGQYTRIDSSGFWIGVSFDPTHIHSVFNPVNPNSYHGKGLVYEGLDGEVINFDDLSAFEIIKNWKGEWAESFIVLHPEYSCLEQCGSDTNIGEFAAIFDLVTSYKEAIELGLFNPMPNGAESSFTNGTLIPFANNGRVDPLFLVNSTIASSFKNKLNNFLGSGTNLWQYAAYVANCRYEVGQSNIQDCKESVEANPIPSYPENPNACFDDMIWPTFQALYSSTRQDVYREYLASQPACSAQVPNGKEPRINFEPLDSIFANDTNLADTKDQNGEFDPTLVANKVLESCTNSCEAQADYWMGQLKDCLSTSADSLNSADSLSIRQRLIAVCQKGCTLNDYSTSYGGTPGPLKPIQYPDGTSTLPSGMVSDMYNDNSFQDVLDAVLGSGGNTAYCTADLIATPRPYDVPPAIEPLPVIDTCACNAYLSAKEVFYNQPSQVPAAITSLDQYIEYLYEQEADRSDLIACRCDQAYTDATGSAWTSNAVWPANAQTFIDPLVYPHMIPVPGVSCKTCVSCTEFTVAFNAAEAKWQSLQQRLTDDIYTFSDSLTNHHRVVANSINKDLGFNLTYFEFLAFRETCAGLNDKPACTVDQMMIDRLETFFGVLSASGNIYNHACLCLNPYDEYNQVDKWRGYDDYLANHAEPGFSRENCNQEYYFDSIVNGALKGRITNGSGNDCLLSLEALNAVDSVYLSLGKILNIDDLKILPTLGTSYRFTVTANIEYNNSFYEVILAGETSCFPLGECTSDPDEAMLCNDPDDKSDLEEPDCYEEYMDVAMGRALERYNSILDSLKNYFAHAYPEACMQALERFDLDYDMPDYPYTLYYYGQAGNLLKTIPPQGFRPLQDNEIALVKQARKDTTVLQPDHTMETAYTYNSMNKVSRIWQPDMDSLDTDNQFVSNYGISIRYDNLGRAIQKTDRRQREYAYSEDRFYTYTNYDDLGRIIETGERGRSFNQESEYVPYTGGLLLRHDVTRTVYENSSFDPTIAQLFGTEGQENTRNRVSSILYFDYYKENQLDLKSYKFASHYSYDEHGNVKTLVQDYKWLAPLSARFFRIDYAYDLISGNVKQVSYQAGKPDAFYHRYAYDENNRITGVQTSTDAIHWENDARYDYYRHGPLARIEIGEQNVQGLDYAYTINGWLKGINSKELGISDAGQDGYLLSGNRWHARDAFGMQLDYFEGDYTPAKSSVVPNDPFINALAPGVAEPANLHNGNIKRMHVSQRLTLDSIAPVTQTPYTYNTSYNYSYDQLNRIKAMWTNTSNKGVASGGKYNTEYTYDFNGNIETLKRNDGEGSIMDDLSYAYNQNISNSTSNLRYNNRLQKVTESVQNNGDNGDYKGSNNPLDAIEFLYNGRGDLVQDQASGIDSIVWNDQGKVERIYRADTSGSPGMLFRYDGLGNRVMKATIMREETAPQSGVYKDKPEEDWVYTFYTRDAQGNVMAVYNLDLTAQAINVGETTSKRITENLLLKEHYLYGSDRLGSKPQEGEGKLVSSGTFGQEAKLVSGSGGFELQFKPFSYDRYGRYVRKAYVVNSIGANENATAGLGLYGHQVYGLKQYELKNHLGNVMAVISDRKKSHYTINLTNPLNIIINLENFEPELLSQTDYYPFGMIMPGRSFTSDNYRYGYQGSEKDDEISGTGNSYATYFRQLDVRLGRWWGVDPKAALSPWESPYMSMGGNPILNTDILGDKWKDRDSKNRADNFRKKGNKLNSKLNSQKTNLEGTLAKNEKGSDKYNNAQEKLNNVNDKISELKSALFEVGVLENSDQVYELRMKTMDMQSTTYKADNDGFYNPEEDGGTFYENGTVVVEYQMGNYDRMAHELKHAYQFEIGETSFSRATGGPGSAHDLFDESAGFKRGSLFNSKLTAPLLKLTPSEVIKKASVYSNMPKINLTIFSTGHDILIGHGRKGNNETRTLQQIGSDITR